MTMRQKIGAGRKQTTAEKWGAILHEGFKIYRLVVRLRDACAALHAFHPPFIQS